MENDLIKEENSNIEKAETNILEKIYKLLFLVITASTIIFFIKPIIIRAVDIVKAIIALLKGIYDKNYGGLYFIFDMFAIPMLLIALIGAVIAIILVIVVAVYKIRKTGKINGLDFLCLIPLYMVNSIFEGAYYSIKNFKYYIAVCLEYAVIIELILLIIILIVRRKKVKELKNKE